MEDKIVVTTDRAAGPFGGAPYSQAIVSNGFVFTAGQIGAAADGSGLVGDTVEAQTEQVMANLRRSSKRRARAWTRSSRRPCFLSDLANFGAFNEVYRKHFGGAFPARSTFGVSLPAGVARRGRGVAASLARGHGRLPREPPPSVDVSIGSHLRAQPGLADDGSRVEAVTGRVTMCR